MKELSLQSDNSAIPKSANDWEQHAYQLAFRQEWQQAADALQKAADADPSEAKRWLTIVTWRQYGGQTEEAIDALTQALHIPNNTNTKAPISTFTAKTHWSKREEIDLWTALAHLYAQDSRWPLCEEACMEVLERQPDNLEITELMATACLQTEHLDAAEHLLQTLLRRVPLDPWYRMRYSTLLQMQGKLSAAHLELQRLQLTKLPEQFAKEVEDCIEYLDQKQFQQVMVLLEHNVELRNALARNPRDELKTLGFQLTEPTIEIIQNVLWEHFNQAPFNAPEMPEHVPRIH